MNTHPHHAQNPGQHDATSTNPIAQRGPSVAKRHYAAKYGVEYFARKRIPSYALWAVMLKDPETGCYERLPAGFGRTETLEQAHLALTAWCQARSLTLADLRQDLMPWRLVKDLLEGKNGAEYFARGVKRRAVIAQVLSVPKPNTDLVFVVGGRAYTDSRKVAEKFGKRHKNVLQAIDKLPRDEFWRLNFQPTDYVTEQGRTERCYQIAWKGFSILAMGFTGHKAYEWKRDFLDAFEAMGDYIVRLTQAVADPPRTELLADKRQAGRYLTDALVEARQVAGKPTCAHHFMTEARLCNWAMTGEFSALDEQALNNDQLTVLGKIRDREAALLVAGLEYPARKAHLADYARRLRPHLIAVGS